MVVKRSCQGVGLGLRRQLLEPLLSLREGGPSFIELAPENWIGLGGRWSAALSEIAKRYPISCHGLSLSLGSPEPLDWDFLRLLKRFLNSLSVTLYSEHLSFCKCDNAHLYDLLPLPFQEEAIHHVATRIREVQDFLERQIFVENISYYASVAPEMDEAAFLTAVVEEAGCGLLLDINNVYVNAHNHGYDAHHFIDALPLDRVGYIHMAGHEQVSKELIIDTHGAPIVDPVFDLLEWTLPRLEPAPVLLERDFNFPSYDELKGELAHLEGIVQRAWRQPALAMESLTGHGITL